ncbi:DUF4160 domain-containing protein [Stenotrophomonas sp. PD6]|uniref:DUF4160 domain-containing protein n=1 Tax=Stenotrophomonas sp. PD6 TaxID=3368612 RepID=UPI003BA2F436
MPNVARINGLRVVIYPNDHGPAHVHIIGGGSEAVFLLRCPSGPPELRSNTGFTLGTLRGLRPRLAEMVPRLCAHWRRIHDDIRA